MLASLREALEKPDRRPIAEARRLDDVIDRLNTAIKSYLTGLDPAAMAESDHRRAEEILVFAHNLAHGIEPVSIHKAIHDLTERMRVEEAGPGYDANKGAGKYRLGRSQDIGHRGMADVFLAPRNTGFREFVECALNGAFSGYRKCGHRHHPARG